MLIFFFFSSRRRHTRSDRDWSSDVCSSDLPSSLHGSPLKSAVPSEVDVSVRANGEPCKLLGHYDPLRRAFANLLRNAARSEERRVGEEGRSRWAPDH